MNVYIVNSYKTSVQFYGKLHCKIMVWLFVKPGRNKKFVCLLILYVVRLFNIDIKGYGIKYSIHLVLFNNLAAA